MPEGTEEVSKPTFKDVKGVSKWTDEVFMEFFEEYVNPYDGATLGMTRDNPQRYLNAIHDANLLLQTYTKAYETIKAATKLSKIGKEKRTELINDSRNKPDFFLNIGPAGDLPIHLACLLQDGQLGIDMLKAVQCSTKLEGKGGYWESCEGLINKYGEGNMPALPKKDEKCLLCNRSFCQHMLHTFIINIPYQNDITWWLKEIERREKTSEKSEKFEKLLPIKIRSQMADKGREAGLFSGETLLHVAIAKKQPELIQYLLKNGANVYAQAVGTFFQPRRGDKLLDFHQGTYYGPTPLCFAASLSRGRRIHLSDINIYNEDSLDEKESEEKTWANLLPLLMKHAKDQITQGLSQSLDLKKLRALESMLSAREDEQSNRRLGMFSFCGRNKVDHDPEQNAYLNAYKSLGFLDQLVWQWYTLCHESNMEDWYRPLVDPTTAKSTEDKLPPREKKYWYFRKEFFEGDPSDDAVERVEWSPAHQKQVAQDLLVAFVNTRDKYGNSALHLAVEHHNEFSLQFLLKKNDNCLEEGEGDEEPCSADVGGNECAGNDFNAFSGLGCASLTLLNWKDLTPFTFSVHLARVDDKKSLNSYRTILECAYRQTVWQFGVHDMRITSLYQIDTFRVQSKQHRNKLHMNPNYACILQIVVDYEVPVLNDLPELEELVAEKWNKFAYWQHMKKAVLPYCVIVVALTIAITNRIQDLKDHSHVVYTGPVVYDGQDQFQIAVEVLVYLFGVPFLLYNAWAASRLGLVNALLGKGSGRKGILFRLLDANLDGKVSYDEAIMFVFKNMDSVLSTSIAGLLLAAAAIRFSSHPHWLRVLAESFEEETGGYRGLSQELDVLSVAALLAWLNVLFLLVPFKATGLMFIALFRMLSRDIVKWLFLYLIILCAFSLSGLAMLYEFADALNGDDTEESLRTRHADARLRKSSVTKEFDGTASLVTWPDMLKFFIWSSVGEVNPGSVLANARSPATALSMYLFFVVLSTLVLMNLLISLMSNTFATDTAHGRQIWWFEFAALVLRYEAHLSEDARKRHRCGTFIRDVRFKNVKSKRGKHDVEWWDVRFKNAKESESVRNWRKNIIEKGASKDFINDKFSVLQERFSELQERLRHIEDLLKNKSKPPATPALRPLKEEEARNRFEAAARESASERAIGSSIDAESGEKPKHLSNGIQDSRKIDAKSRRDRNASPNSIERDYRTEGRREQRTMDSRLRPEPKAGESGCDEGGAAGVESADASASGAPQTQERRSRRSRRKDTSEPANREGGVKFEN